jgi:two-component system sensor histidine kinase/response regulator
MTTSRKKTPGVSDIQVSNDDDSARSKVDREMIGRETQFLLALENNSDIITVFDRNGKITYQSTAIGRILGIDPQSRIGANIFDSEFVHPEDRTSIRNFVNKLIASKDGQELKGEFRLRHVDGSFRDIEAIGINMLGDPALHAVVLSSRDVTDRKAALAALAESEAKYAITFNNAPIGIAHCEPEDGWFLLVNQYLCDILGYSHKELSKKRFKDITGPKDLKVNLVAVEDLKAGKITNYQREQRCYRKDRSAVWINLRMTIQRNANGALDYYLITVEDISERKRAEAATKKQHELEAKATVLAEQREQLIAISKAKDEFVSLASHQLRTPATGVKQYVGLILQGYIGPVSATQQDFLTKAYDSNECQLRTINQLLYVARLDAGKIKLQLAKFNVSRLLTDIIEEQQLSFKERDQNILLVMPTDAVEISADERLLRMAIENLVDNAGKYSPVGKNITVSLRVTSKQVKIAVIDQGIGIALREQSNLFQKFSRIENPQTFAAGGTGLGLYWAKKIIDLHEGKLHLSSKQHLGSTFTIALLR